MKNTVFKGKAGCKKRQMSVKYRRSSYEGEARERKEKKEEKRLCNMTVKERREASV